MTRSRAATERLEPPPRSRGRTVVDRSMWIREGLELLAGHGIAAVRIELLARRLSVTKGSFYWHFRDRQALLDGMLREWRRSTLTAVVESVWGRPTDARQKLQRLWRICLSGRPDNPGGQLEAALREWSLSDRAVADLITAVDQERITFATRLYADLGVDDPDGYARLFYDCVVGHNTVALRLDSQHRADAVTLRALQLAD